MVRGRFDRTPLAYRLSTDLYRIDLITTCFTCIGCLHNSDSWRVEVDSAQTVTDNFGNAVLSTEKLAGRRGVDVHGTLRCSCLIWYPLLLSLARTIEASATVVPRFHARSLCTQTAGLLQHQAARQWIIPKAAVGMGIPMEIPIGMGMGWVWGLSSIHIGLWVGYERFLIDVRFSGNALNMG